VPGSRRWTASLLAPLALVLAGGAPAAAPEPAGAPSPLPAELVARQLGELGLAVTRGASPGYADERSCALCHPGIAASYAERGMARAFRRPQPTNDVEDFAAPPFVHAASGQTLRIARVDRRGDRLVFERWQTDAGGRPILRLELTVDWILGSGDHARTYLYRTPAGELYQLPLAWYAETRSWGMAPGFDRRDHDGVTRRVRRECIFCHTDYPEMPAGADAYGAPQVFPRQLPEGIGCQRCHGPAAEHVWYAMGGMGVREEIRGSVFNPGRLPPKERDEVCMACHLQPSVAIPGLRRFGRGDFSFRPGEPLAGYLVPVDVDEEARAPGERFEINHHPYRLRQSRCFRESGGALSCLTCHDPHRRIPPAEREAHFRAACLTCHRADDCRRPAPHAEPGDCAGCHMPKRRTEDVVHAVVTDHLIRRRPGGPELLAPRAEAEPALAGVHLLDPRALPGALGEVYRAAAVVRAVSAGEAVDRLQAMLAAARPPEIEPWLDLAQGLLRRRRFAEAERTLAEILARRPDHPLALQWLALARAGQGRTDEAIALLRRAIASGPPEAEPEYNLGRLLATGGRDSDTSAEHLERAVALRPNLVAAWYRLGELRAARGEPAKAVECFRRALEIDPAQTDSYVALGKALAARGDRAEALRYLRHGARAAAHPEIVAAALAEMEAEMPGHP